MDEKEYQPGVWYNGDITPDESLRDRDFVAYVTEKIKYRDGGALEYCPLLVASWRHGMWFFKYDIDWYQNVLESEETVECWMLIPEPPKEVEYNQ